MVKNKKRANWLIAGIFLIALISGAFAVEVSYCCERLKNNGAFCQNAPLSECDTAGVNPNTNSPYKAVPTSCEATSYCRMGCCNIIDDGECMRNTPMATCGSKDDGATHFIQDSPKCDIPQCSLGCCMMGDQAAFVTQTKCNKLSALYGLKINFREDIKNEIECLATATAEVKGACVFEKEFTRTCKMLTQKECNEMKANSENQNVNFYEGHLCSDPALGTECAPTQKTTCVEGKDEIYFVDTCGNTANVYDASKVKNMVYWSEIVAKTESCGAGESNANNPNCGNCDYVLGSTCKEYRRADEKTTKSPTYGDNICKDLSCKYDINSDGKINEDEKFRHGETFCLAHASAGNEESSIVRAPIKVEEDGYIGGKGSGIYIETIAEEKGKNKLGVDKDENEWVQNPDFIEENFNTEEFNLPGSRYYRMVCYNGEITVEPCADFRQEICVQIDVPVEDNFGKNYFSNSICRVNRWQDCIEQTKWKECLNMEKRDCKLVNIAGDKGKIKKEGQDDKNYICVPLVPPGLKFWGEDESSATTSSTETNPEGEISEDAETICGFATSTCTTIYEQTGEGFFKFDVDYSKSKKDIKSGRECKNGEWIKDTKEFSRSLGDCGEKNNYLGFLGGEWKGIDWKKGKWN